MKTKRIMVLVLCCALAIGSITGCKGGKLGEDAIDNISETIESRNDESGENEIYFNEEIVEYKSETDSGEVYTDTKSYLANDILDEEIVVVESPVNGETYLEIVENQFIVTDEEAISTFSIDVDTASYANVRSMISQGIMPEPDAVRIEEMINYFDYDYDQPKGDTPFSITTNTTVCPWNEDNAVAMIGINGKDIPKDELPPSNIVLLIDVSGSMQDANKLPLLKDAFEELVSNLTAKDRVSLVVYAGAAGVVLEGAEGADYNEIVAALDGLEAGGSTAGGEGIELAYSIANKYYIEGGNNRVVIATDGDFNVGMSNVEELEDYISEKKEEGIFLSVIGFGRGNIRDDVMETLADKGNGNYAYIDTYLEAEKVFTKEFTGTLFAIAKDVKVQVEFNDEVVKSYRLIGYENRVMDNEDFLDDTKDAGELGIGHQVTALYEIVLKDEANMSEDELFNVKLRYKEPDEDTSIGIDHVADNNSFIENPKDDINLLWALSVAEFGMILRDSEFKGDASIDKILENASYCVGVDYDEYKIDFITVVTQYNNLMARDGYSNVAE